MSLSPFLSLLFLFSFLSLSLYLSITNNVAVNTHTDLYVHIFLQDFVEVKWDQRVILLYTVVEVCKLPSKKTVSMLAVYDVPFSPTYLPNIDNH